MTNMVIYKVDPETTNILKKAAAIQYPDWPLSPLSKWARETLLAEAKKVIEEAEAK